MSQLTDEFSTAILRRIPELEFTRLASQLVQPLPSGSFPSPIAIPGAAEWFETLFRLDAVGVLRAVNLTDQEVFILAQQGMLTLFQPNRFPSPISVRAFLENRLQQYPDSLPGIGVPLNQLAALSSSMMELTTVAAAALRGFMTQQLEDEQLVWPLVTVQPGSTWLGFGGSSSLIAGSGVLLATACRAVELAAAPHAGLGIGAGLVAAGVIEMALAGRKSLAETRKTNAETVKLLAEAQRIKDESSKPALPDSNALPPLLVAEMAHASGLTREAIMHLCNRGFRTALGMRATLGPLNVELSEAGRSPEPMEVVPPRRARERHHGYDRE